MGPIPVKQRRFEQTRELMQLDDAEMALSLVELAETTSVTDASKKSATPGMSYDALVEFASAASMIMEKDEYMALARELDHILHPRPVAA